MVLWQYTQIFFITAIFFTSFAFHRNTVKVGKAFYLMAGGISWGLVAWGLWKVTFKWGGDNSVVSYTYIPSVEAWMPYFLGVMGILMIIIGVIRAIECVAKDSIGYKMGGDWE